MPPVIAHHCDQAAGTMAHDGVHPDTVVLLVEGSDAAAHVSSGALIEKTRP